MKLSQVFSKPIKNFKEYESKNATLLIKGGFIDQTMAGVYTFLPLGNRVLQKIEQIIREEMDKIGVEIFMPALAPTELWETSKRLNSIDVLFKVQGANPKSVAKNDATYILNCTHEDIITPLVKKFATSYKQLPFAAYQIQTKFRNEARAKSGIMRGREFRMKDLYSFHANEQDLKQYYEVAAQAYFKVYERLGLKELTYKTMASGGDFTKDFSHEFQVKCEAGEDLVFHDQQLNITYNKEIAPSKSVNLQVPNQTKLQIQKVVQANLKSVQAICDFLKIQPYQGIKTIIFEATFEDQSIKPIVAAIRADYEINEEKLTKVLNCKSLKLASEKTITQITNAPVGYAGIVNLPNSDAILIYDESISELINFSCGANMTDTHFINVNWETDVQKPKQFYDIKMAKEGDLNPTNLQPYQVFKASEVGNIFPLNTKFSQAFDYKYIDQEGKENLVYMGSYGIGSSRLMGVMVEVFNDEKGIIWPKTVAPFTIHLVGLNLEDQQINQKCQTLYQQLISANIEVLFDDRTDVTTGEKLSDADLIGCPYRLLVSKKTNDKIEFKPRTSTNSQLLDLQQILQIISN